MTPLTVAVFVPYSLPAHNRPILNAIIVGAILPRDAIGMVRFQMKTSAWSAIHLCEVR